MKTASNGEKIGCDVFEYVRRCAAKMFLERDGRMVLYALYMMRAR